jgi:hypothetical protein
MNQSISEEMKSEVFMKIMEDGIYLSENNKPGTKVPYFVGESAEIAALVTIEERIFYELED